MHEPIYCNASKTATVSSAGDFLAGAELTAAISDAQRLFKRSEPAKELKDKYRYAKEVLVTII